MPVRRKHYFIELTDRERVRVELEIERGRVTDFVVQLETFTERWRAVVRYNYAHGAAHRDLLFADGRKRKEFLSPGLRLEEVAVTATRDLRDNYAAYLRRLGYHT